MFCTYAADSTPRTRSVDPVLSTKYIQNSLVVDSAEMRTIQECAAKHGIVVSLGFSENDNNSLYIAQAIIEGDGTILMKRRKLKPTQFVISSLYSHPRSQRCCILCIPFSPESSRIVEFNSYLFLKPGNY